MGSSIWNPANSRTEAGAAVQSTPAMLPSPVWRLWPSWPEAISRGAGLTAKASNGLLSSAGAPQNGAMYNHGFGTLFLAEAYGMVTKKDLQKRVRETLERAVAL